MRELFDVQIEQANGFSLYGTPVCKPPLRLSHDLSSVSPNCWNHRGAFPLLLECARVGEIQACMQAVAQRFPRSRVAGFVLLTIALLWTFWLLATMEMGEFASFRRPLLIALPIGFLLVLRFVDEFLAVRALGILFLLALNRFSMRLFFATKRAGSWSRSSLIC